MKENFMICIESLHVGDTGILQNVSWCLVIIMHEFYDLVFFIYIVHEFCMELFDYALLIDD